MLAFPYSEAINKSDQTREALEALSKQLDLANRAASRFRTSFPNRDEALAELSREISGPKSDRRYVAIFVADVFSALRLRHGNEVSEHLLDEVSRKSILPSIPGGKIYRWSAQSILAIWHSQKEPTEIRAEIANLCQMPVDCQVFVGTRTATFRIGMRFACLDGQFNTAEFVRTLDGFVKGADVK